MSKQAFLDIADKHNFADNSYETFHGVVAYIEDKYQIEFPFFSGGINYGEQEQWHLTPNYDFSGIPRGSKRMIQLNVIRLESGRYEVTDYIL